MAYSSIVKPTDYFNTKLHTGNGSTQSITGVGFQPDFTWIKDRSGGNDHQIVDAVRGATKAVSSNRNDSATHADGLTSFDSDGYSLGNNTRYNGSSTNYVGWNWKANGAGSSNTDGSVTSTVSVNTTAGFSISKYTGTGSNLTFGHGLGAIPDWIMIKNLDVSQAWRVYHQKMTASDPYSKRMVLSETGAETSNALGLSQDPTASLIYLDNSTGCTNDNGEDFICYAWTQKKGYSKFGSYIGNGNSDGTFVYTGFKPAFVIIKRADSSDGWHLFDNKRDVDNVIERRIEAESESAENTSIDWCDFLSNGIKHRYTGGGTNASGGTYIYMAFAEAPFVANNSGTAVPVTAK